MYVKDTQGPNLCWQLKNILQLANSVDEFPYQPFIFWIDDDNFSL